ncbi:MAG: hypothetical protein MUE37_12575 [Bacteroidales bacterium]|nr:hypothetical protein [Bacteroidales bacterium]
MKITRNLPYAILMAFIIRAFTIGETAAQSTAPAYMQLTDEQKEKLNDALELSKSMVTESQEKLTEMLNHWGILKDNFHRLPPQLQDAINKIEGEGFTAKVNFTIGKLKQFEGRLRMSGMTWRVQLTFTTVMLLMTRIHSARSKF